MRLILEAYSDEPPTRHLGELPSNPDIIEDVTGDETMVGSGDVASISPNKSAELATSDTKQTVEGVDPADILRDRESIMAGVREQIRELAEIHNPEQLVQGYEKPFRDALRVEICAELERLLTTGGEQLELARTRYAAQFAHLFDELGLRDSLGLNEIKVANELNDNVSTVEHDDSELLAQINTLHARAETVNLPFQDQMSAISDQATDCFHQKSEVKTVARMREKITGDYGGVVALLKDSVRCRLTYSGNPVADGARLEQLIRKFSLTISVDDETGAEMIKNRFIRNGQYISLDLITRYTDIKIIVELPMFNNGKIPAEIVLATPEMATATKVEHALYEITRVLNSDVKKQEDANQLKNSLGDVKTALYARPSEASKRFYSLVSHALSARTEPTPLNIKD